MFSKHSLIEGAKNLTRSFWLSVTAITVLVVSLSSVAIVLILRTSISYSIRQLDKNIEIVAFLQTGLEEKTLQELQQDLSRIPQVQEVRYINDQQAREELMQSLEQAEGFKNSLLNLDFPTHLDYFIIKIDKAENYQQVFNLLSNDSYAPVFKKVLGKQEFIERLQNLYYWTNLIGIVVVFIFALIAIMVMVNMLKIAIYNYKGEIEIMRLVGATNSYIQGPFIMQGTYFTLIACLLVWVIFLPLTNFLVNYFVSTLDSQTSNLLLEIYLSLGMMTIISVLVSIVTSYLSTQKYLQQ
jgi:cell division transport system permease protein